MPVSSASAAQKILRDLTKRRLLVGIPAENNARPDSVATNALLGYVHNFGSPVHNIPARPHLVPGVEAALPEITKKLQAAAAAAIAAGDAHNQMVTQQLEQAGIIAVNHVRRIIQAGIPPPLTPATVAARRRRTPGSRYRRKAEAPADVTPLIDTGALLKSYTYVIRDA